MIKFLKSFYGKLSLVFLLLLLILGVVQFFITMEATVHYINEVDQKLNHNLARDMAAELKPLLKGKLNIERIGERIHYMMVINPKVEIYLLDASGEILAFFAEPGKEVKSVSVDLAPVREFLTSAKSIPLLGDDPRTPGRKKPFSVAPLNLGSSGDGFLYIVIGSQDYDSILALARDSYIFRVLARGLNASVAFAGIIGLILFAFLTKRIRYMAAVVQDFEKGNYRKRIEKTSDDEIGQLGRAFNRMADTIVANIDTLKKTDDLRRELVANVSHDLRTPLASIQGYLETIMMKESTLDAKDRHHYLDIILGDTERLNKMVHELFDLSKFEAQQIQPQPEPFSLAELAQDVVMKFKAQADKHNIALQTAFQPDLPFVTADIALIERALSNLIENAINYTPSGGTVSIELQQHDGKITTIVADTGCGIPPEDLPHIFDRFYRGSKAKSRNKSSTGLGLAIAQKILQLHASSITVESKEDVGTKFQFELG